MAGVALPHPVFVYCAGDRGDGRASVREVDSMVGTTRRLLSRASASTNSAVEEVASLE